MGYYDDGRAGRNQRGPSKSGYFLASLAGLILGALLVIIALPKLADYDILPGGESNEQVHIEQNDEQPKGQNVSLNITTDVTKAVDKAQDTVVGITNIQSGSFWEEESAQPAGTGSGVIYKKSGDKAYIVTNYHVIEGAQQLEVTLADGTKVPAKMRGGDIWTDLAVVEIDGKNVKKVAEFGDSDALKIGEPVIAIGNPLGLEFSGSVTQGVISGLERAIPVDINGDNMIDWQAEVLQTDAAINPGNSGGALVNIAGQVIGINSMKIAQSAVEGIGLSIPINFAKPIIDSLEKNGKMVRPAMGVTLRNVNEIPAYHQQETLKLPREINDGAMVEQVMPNTPASKAGLQEFDVIVKLDNQAVRDILELRKYMYNKKKVGDKVEVTFYRSGKKQKTTMTLTSEEAL
ncbi:PDZ domain-containing protein [Bacillus aerolatus]|uniref:PDZ domain-containing protein n=1 Tax=Bacillus aerolatus TaxID=2653354 RepID=A0A6I1FMX0_9BACI|nr:trypsin-like peptidase domain-containing protein [Bacillus aerolatus]KAB7707601.1 PDZ domain-containing protein [Bacillus aerolatus]